MDTQKKDTSYLSEPNELFEDAMAVFIRTFSPANKKNATDIFTSREINSLILEHAGIDVSITDINVYLLSKGFTFTFDEGQFKWTMQKADSAKAVHRAAGSDPSAESFEAPPAAVGDVLEMINNIRFGS